MYCLSQLLLSSDLLQSFGDVFELWCNEDTVNFVATFDFDFHLSAFA